MAATKSKKMQEKMLDVLIGTCEVSAIRVLAGLGGANRPRIRKDHAVQAITQQVAGYYQDHPLENALLTRQAKVYQKYFFRQKIRKLREKIQTDDISDEIRSRYEQLIAMFKSEYRLLNELDSQDLISRHLAQYYAEDMVAELNPAFFSTFKLIAYRIFSNFARGIRVVESNEAIRKIKPMIGMEPVFFVPNHISNADHIPICLALNQSGLPQPLIAAGANLFRGVSAKVMPRLNAYKIRREHIGGGIGLLQTRWFQNPIYRRVHSQYLRYAWEHNEPCMFYIEGTRSRTGLIGEPKLGIISEVIQYLRDTGRRAHFVPVSMSYSLVLEDMEIEAARTGINISSKDLIAQLMDLDKIYGMHENATTQLRFGDPIVATADSDAKEFGNQLITQIKGQLMPSWTSRLAVAIEKECAQKGKTKFNQKKIYERIGEGYSLSSAEQSGLDSALTMFKGKGFIAADEEEDDWQLLESNMISQYANRIK